MDLVIRGGTVVDGSGGPPRTADVGIDAGHIVEVGTVASSGKRAIDADGLLVTKRAWRPSPTGCRPATSQAWCCAAPATNPEDGPCNR